MQVEFLPYVWCQPHAAAAWLESEGWKVDQKRSVRRGISIPSPRDGRLYDLHDVLWEMERDAEREGTTPPSIESLMEQIRSWAAPKFGDAVCGVGEPHPKAQVFDA